MTLRNHCRCCEGLVLSKQGPQPISVAMWNNVVDVAREASVHPRDVLLAINEGRAEGREIKGAIFVRTNDVATLNLPHVAWFTASEWADLKGTYYRNVRRQMTDGVLDSVDDGPRRRWVLRSDVGALREKDQVSGTGRRRCGLQNRQRDSAHS